MMDIAVSIIAPLVSAGVGGITSGWMARGLLSRYIQTNDQYHGKWSDQINEMTRQIAIIQTKLDSLNGISKEVAVIRTTCDMNHANKRGSRS